MLYLTSTAGIVCVTYVVRIITIHSILDVFLFTFFFFPTENFINFPLREQVSLSIILIAEFAEANYNLFYTAVCEWCFQYATLFLTRKKHKLLG